MENIDNDLKYKRLRYLSPFQEEELVEELVFEYSSYHSWARDIKNIVVAYLAIRIDIYINISFGN